MTTLSAPSRAPGTQTPPPPDCALVYALVGVVRHSQTEALLRACGPDVLPTPEAKALARTVLTGDPGYRGALTEREQHRFDALLSAVRQTHDRGIIAATPAEALHYVQLLADKAHRLMLVEGLRWAADRVLGGWPIDRVRREVNTAFAVATGEARLESVLDAGRAA